MSHSQNNNYLSGTLITVLVGVFLLAGAVGGYFLYSSSPADESNTSMTSQEDNGFFTNNGSDQPQATSTTNTSSEDVAGEPGSESASASVRECTSLSCINNQLSACSPATYSSSAGEQLAAEYEIQGEVDNACRVELVYTSHPDQNREDKSLVCNYDTSLTLPEASQKALQSILANNQAECSGALYEVILGN